MSYSRHAKKLSFLVVLFAMVLSSCSLGRQLKSETADPRSITGTYDLIAYGCRFPDDLERAVFLVIPEKTDSLELFVPATSYKIKRGLSADKALEEANRFVRCGNYTVEELRIHRIPDGGTGTLGYEVLPRYSPFDDGGTDPLQVTYSLKDGKVRVYIRLHPDVDRKINLQSPIGGGS
jgi:hypothetical protein